MCVCSGQAEPVHAWQEHHEGCVFLCRPPRGSGCGAVLLLAMTLISWQAFPLSWDAPWNLLVLHSGSLGEML